MLYSLYLPLFYMICFVMAVTVSFSVNQFRSAIFLTLLFLCGWIDAIWYDAVTHMLAALVLATFMLFLHESKTGMYLSVLTIGMVIADGLQVMLQFHDFYRLSALNIIFFVQCLIVFTVGYTTHKRDNIERQVRDDIFLARNLHKGTRT